MSKDIFRFPLSTARLISLSLVARTTQLGQAERAKRGLRSTFKKPAWNHGMLGHLGFELRTFRPTRRGSSNDMIALSFSTMPADWGPFRTEMLKNSSLLSAVTESRETAPWPGLHLSDFTLCWQRTALKA